jgi:hypothetical protein
MLAATLTAMGGVALAFGLWLFSKFRPLRLRLVEDSPIRMTGDFERSPAAHLVVTTGF